MIPLRLGLVLTALAATAGCVYLPLGKLPQNNAASLATTGRGTLRLQPEISSGGFRTQTLLNPWSAADVDVVRIKLYRLEGTTPVPVTGADGQPLVKDVASNSLTVPVTFTNLHPHATYTVVAAAYSTASVLISDVASSTTTVAVDNDDRPTLGKLKLALLPRLFAAVASNSLDLTNGVLTNEEEDVFLPTAQ